MKTVFRSLLVWLMLVALPFQGFASAGMLLCGPEGQAFAQAQAVQGEHDHAAMLAAQEAQAGHGSAAHAGHDGGDGHDGHGAAKCASAGACCVGAPLAPSVAAGVPPLDSGSQRIPFHTVRPPAVDLAVPERPPQSLFA
ncbi:hypothetical protein [Pseudoduganella namucuonensis]|uniref:DUF2946 domain-containing protein n=1 Tax=Pseudoduganella namucuonensis TaxID=1035707 RepID=A0A1I7GRA0_9BURK|nr:hypothetical protein [Pseudoduganella namucuonensis]SFU50881.1 hypothetical protein SAMN05216552_100442 [Pseudoduganella namucuonensis]